MNEVSALCKHLTETSSFKSSYKIGLKWLFNITTTGVVSIYLIQVSIMASLY
jgi:hypothetical protein